MNNRQQILSVLVSGPNITNFDDVPSLMGNNENYFTFNINDHICFGQDGNEDTIVTDSSDNSNDILIRYLCGYSDDTDSNELSRSLVNNYRGELINKLQHAF